MTGSGPLWFDSLAMLIAALLGARQLQRSAQRAALERADSLRGVAFLEFARRLDGDGPDATVVEVPLSALAPGDRVEVRSGELVPVDGVVLSGRSSLDNAVLTGEPAPLAVARGRRGERRRHQPRRAPGRARRRHRRPDARRRAARHRAGGAVAQARRCCRPPTSWPGASCRCCSSWPRVTWRGVAGRSGPEVALTRVVALLVVSCPCALGLGGAAGHVGGADARRPRRHLRQEPRRARAAAHGSTRCCSTRPARSPRAAPRSRAGTATTPRCSSPARSKRSRRTRSPAPSSRPPGAARCTLVRTVERRGRGRRPRHHRPGRRPRRARRQPRARRCRGRTCPTTSPPRPRRWSPTASVRSSSRSTDASPAWPASATGCGPTRAPPSPRCAPAASACASSRAIIPASSPASAPQLGLPADDALGGLTPEDKRDVVAGLVSGAERRRRRRDGRRRRERRRGPRAGRRRHRRARRHGRHDRRRRHRADARGRARRCSTSSTARAACAASSGATSASRSSTTSAPRRWRSPASSGRCWPRC